jgi:CAAX prenyl protease-like protein
MSDEGSLVAEQVVRSNGFFSNPWLVFLLPFAVYLVVGSFEPLPPPPDEAELEQWLDLGARYEHYPWIYGVKILLTAIAIVAVARGYPPRRALHPLAYVVGVLGVVAWVALAHFQRWAVATLDMEQVTDWLGGHRPAYNPIEQLGRTPAGFLFLAVRFAGLAAIVPLIEEMFLRGFLMRYFARADWWNVPIGTPDQIGVAAAIVLPVLMHPQEALAAVIWFGAVAWLVIRTRNVWDCVVAHAITNLLLGIYVVTSGEWWLM